MSSKISLKWLLGLFGLTGILFLAIIIFSLKLDSPNQNSFIKQTVLSVSSDNSVLQNLETSEVTDFVQTAVFLEQTTSVLPIHLRIPKINVEADIESVGLTAQGAVGVPKDPSHTAWYNLSSYPGDIGSAVITGHYGRWKNGSGSVFDNLNKLDKGDSLFIEDEKGIITAFVVREIRIYSQNESVPEVFISNDGKVHLNLITCDGTWNSVSKTFSDRLVVFADKE